MNKQIAQIKLAAFGVLPALFVPIVLGFTMSAVPSPIHAQILGDVIQCAGTHQASWNPAITDAAQNVQVTTESNWSTCIDLTNPLQLLTLKASSDDSFMANFSCESLVSQDPNSVTWTINWNNGHSPSSYTFSPSISDPDGNLVVTALGGKITGGYLNGYSVQSTFVLNGLAAIVDDGCKNGVAGASGATTLTLTPPLAL